MGSIGYGLGLTSDRPFGFKRDDDVAAAFAPSDLGGLEIWLDATNGPVVEGSNTLTGWTDQSDNAYAFSSRNGAAAILQASAINGLAAVNFGGGHYTQALTTSIGSTYSIFMVFQLSATAATIYSMGGNGGSAKLYYGPWQSKIHSFYAGTTLNGTGAADTLPHISGAIQFGGTTSSYLWLDGATNSAGNFGAAALNSINIGRGPDGGGALNGLIGEFLLYNTALSAADVAQVDTYLNDRWAAY